MSDQTIHSAPIHPMPNPNTNPSPNPSPNHHNNHNNNNNNNNNNFPICVQPEEQRVPLYLVERKNPSQRGEMEVSVQSIAPSQLQGLGVGEALITASGVAAGTSVVVLGGGGAIVFAGIGVYIIIEAYSLAQFSLTAGGLALLAATYIDPSSALLGAEIFVLAGAGFSLACIQAGLGVELLNLSGVIITESIKYGSHIIKESLRLGYEMATGNQSIGQSSNDTLNSHTLQGFDHEPKIEEVDELEFEQTIEEVEELEFVENTRASAIEWDEFLMCG